MKKSLIAAVLICLLAQPLQSAWADEVIPAETPAAAVEVTETPKTEATETPKTEVTETPKTEVTETPKTEVTETPKTEVTETPTAQASETPEATETATETPSVSPEATVTPEPTETPSAQTLPSVSEKTQIPEDAEAWMQVEEGYAYGTLEALIAHAQEGDTIVLHTQEVMHIKVAPVLKLSKLAFTWDEDVFSGDEWKITYLKDDPENTETPEELDAETFKDAQEEDTLEMFVRVDSTKETPEEPEAPEEIVLNVDVDDYRAGEWSNVLPTFTLSGKPEDESYSYALVIYDERIALLSENVYTAETEGVYTVRFAILNGQGDIVSASERYTLMLDATAPEVSAYVDYEKSYTLRLSATDSMSGVSEISMDGGNNWTALADGEEWVYTAKSKQTIEPGMLQVRDVAGNVWENTEAYALEKISSGGGGGGGDGGSGTKKPEHAAGNKEEGPDYDTVELVFPEEAMTVLTMGEAEMPLTLELSDSGDFVKPENYEAKFTAALQTWPKPEEYDEDGNLIVEENPAPDTLILTAVEEDNMGDRFEYRWKVNGEVFRLLENSGIKYLVLNVHDNYAVFPTAGFTGGTVYTELRMNGFSVKKFDYTIAMTVNLDPDHIPAISETDFSTDCDFAVQVEADDQKYVMSAEQKGEMYFYDVTLGPEAMLEVPYGQYALTQTEDGRTDA